MTWPFEFNRAVVVLKFLLIGRFFSSFSNHFLIFVLPLLIYKITQDIGWSGQTYALEWTMRLLSLVFSGYALAALGLWRSLLISDALRFLSCLGAAFVLLADQDNITVLVLVLLAMLNGFLFDISFLSTENICQRVASAKETAQLQATLQFIDQTALIGAPLIGAAVLLWLPPVTMILLAAVAYGLSFFLVFIQQFHTKVPTVIQKMRGLVSTAVREVFSDPLLLRLVIETNAINLLFGTVLVLNPAIITGFYQQTDSFFALSNFLLGGIGLLSVLLAPASARYVGRHFGRVCVGLAVLSATMIGLLPLGIWGYLVLAGGIIGLDGAFAVYLRTERAKALTAEKFQRVIPIMMMLNAIAFPLSGLMVSLLSNYMHSTLVFLSLAALSLLLLLSEKILPS